MQLKIEPSLSAEFIGLRATIRSIAGVTVEKNNGTLDEFRKAVIEEVRSKYTLETLKDVHAFRSYRDFFWRVGIDPTKVRPAAEALIRRILTGKSLPVINTLVDTYNLASIKTGIALAAFDQSQLHGSLLMRSAKTSEEFSGIGMSKPMQLNGGEIVVSDNEKLIAVYPYRDAESSKVSERTKGIILMICGCPGIDDASLIEAEHIATDLIVRFCDGRSNGTSTIG